MRPTKFVAALFAVILLSAHGFGQTVSGSIAGTVLDATQAAVGNAKVTAVEQSKKTTASATTDVEGRFVFPQMQPGTYDITVEAAGFKLVEEGNFLRHPEDPREAAVFRPQVPTDEFVLKYQKPM